MSEARKRRRQRMNKRRMGWDGARKERKMGEASAKGVSEDNSGKQE